MAKTVAKVQITCVVTGETKEVAVAKDGEPSLKNSGWKLLHGSYYSPTGLRQKFYPRSIQLPVAACVEGYEGDDWSMEKGRAGWESFRGALRTSFRECARVSNYMMRELAKADNDALEHGAKGDKLPKLTAPYLYPLACEFAPTLVPASIATLEKKTKAKYMEHRWEMRVCSSVSLPSFREPMPIPIPASEVRLTMSEQRQPFVRVRVSGQRFTIRLRNGHDFLRQIAGIEKAVSVGDTGEMKLIWKPVPTLQGNGMFMRAGRGGSLQPGIIQAALSVWLPKETKPRERSMWVRTCPETLWKVALDGVETDWQLHGDQVKRWMAEHRCRLQRLADDSKFEKRLSIDNRNSIQTHRDKVCAKHDNRITDFCDKASRMLAGFAQRNRVATVLYDDEDTAWLPQFRWFSIREMVKNKLDESGIAFERAEGGEEEATVA